MPSGIPPSDGENPNIQGKTRDEYLHETRDEFWHNIETKNLDDPLAKKFWENFMHQINSQMQKEQNRVKAAMKRFREEEG